MTRSFLLACAAGAAAAPAATASSLLDRNATNVKLQVNKDNVALISYRAFGRAGRRVVAWGAVNALPVPNPKLKQEGFKVAYLRATGRIRAQVVKGTFTNACRRYSGPALPYFVTGCTAPDGSFWALQSWLRPLPNYGVTPRRTLDRAYELRLSHWKGPLPVLEVHSDWSFRGRFDHFYGNFTYLGHPQFGFASTSYGAPLDKFGVLVYLDTFNSRYGRGWKRENNFLTHRNTAIWCYSLHRHGGRPGGNGRKYRFTAQGPGALPDVAAIIPGPGRYNAARDRAANEEQARSFSDALCKPN